MKKKDVISIIITTLAISVLIVGCVYLSTMPRRAGGGEVIRFYPAHQNEVYIYNNAVIDTQNVTISTVGFDLSEFGIEPSAKIGIGNIDALTLYFAAYHPYQENTRYFGMNLITGKISEIIFESGFDYCDYKDKSFYVHQGYLYYFAWTLTGLEISKDTNDSFCRVPLTGGRGEVIAEYENFTASNSLCFVADGIAVFCEYNRIYACNIDTGVTENLWIPSSEGYDIVNTNVTYYNGLIYFTASAEAREELVPEDPDYYANMTTTSSYLLSLNPKTKKATLITKEPINSYYIEDDRIYYIPKALGTIQIGDRIMPRFSANEVYSFDLNGRNKEKVCSFDGIFEYDILYMNDSIICVQDYYGETFSTSYCVIDRLTGEVTRVTRVVREMRE